jgi:hypothetical protein
MPNIMGALGLKGRGFSFSRAVSQVLFPAALAAEGQFPSAAQQAAEKRAEATSEAPGNLWVPQVRALLGR